MGGHCLHDFSVGLSLCGRRLHTHSIFTAIQFFNSGILGAGLDVDSQVNLIFFSQTAVSLQILDKKTLKIQSVLFQHLFRINGKRPDDG